MTKRLGIALSAGLSMSLLIAADSFAQETHLDILRGKFRMQLEEIVESYEDESLRDIIGGYDKWGYNGQFPTTGDSD